MRLPVAEQLLFLNLPAIRRHIAWRERVCVVRAAQTLIASGLYSQNTAAPAVGMTQGVLSKWLRRLKEFGEEGLLENRAQTRIPASGRRSVAGNVADVWHSTALPSALASRLVRMATANGYNNVAEMFQARIGAWKPSVPVGEISDECLTEAGKLMQAL
ncbi:MAG: hypothetical protein ABSF34_19020, partial [Verrucomicrobiota bacterium]